LILNDSESILPEAFNETIIKLIMKNHNQIKNKNDLRPISLTNFADDTGGIVKSLESVGYFFEEFKKWGKASGASRNEDKTKILAINSSYEKFRNINFVENIKMLGITFDKKAYPV